MKKIVLKCPNCGHVIFYKNWLVWAIYTPFHWFGKRYTKCQLCEKKSWMERLNTNEL